MSAPSPVAEEVSAWAQKVAAEDGRGEAASGPRESSRFQRWDEALDKYPILHSLEAATGLRKVYWALAAAVLFVSLVFFGLGMSFVCHLVGFLYPLYMSFRALEEPEMPSIKQWLMYWVVYGVFNMSENASDKLLNWIPFYYPLKLCFLLWCFLPRFNGATVIFQRVMRPLLATHEQAIEQGIEEAHEAVTDTVKEMGTHTKRASIELGQLIRKKSMNWLQQQRLLQFQQMSLFAAADAPPETPRGVPQQPSPLAIPEDEAEGEGQQEQRERGEEEVQPGPGAEAGRSSTPSAAAMLAAARPPSPGPLPSGPPPPRPPRPVIMPTPRSGIAMGPGPSPAGRSTPASSRASAFSSSSVFSFIRQGSVGGAAAAAAAPSVSSGPAASTPLGSGLPPRPPSPALRRGSGNTGRPPSPGPGPIRPASPMAAHRRSPSPNLAGAAAAAGGNHPPSPSLAGQRPPSPLTRVPSRGASTPR